MIPNPPREAPFRISGFFVLSVAIATALLAATINAESLWTDEAFSAYIASHRSLAACWSTLVGGDSSDLQMSLYYLYLHVWSGIFGQSEIAFRSANFPFILLYSGVLVWASQRLFRSRRVWVFGVLAPLAVTFASDTRPYFDVIALSLTCVTCLLVYLRSPSMRERRLMPWAVLFALLLGAGFHMLTLLVCVPLVLLVSAFYLRDRMCLSWRDWKWPLLVMLPAGAGMMIFFAWTFGRGATYEYAKPDLLSMLSVVFRFAGLSSYSPNRRYDIGFRPFLAAMAISSVALLTGIAALFLAKRRSGDQGFKGLAYALAVGVVQICLLSFAMHQQIEFRHLSCLLPLLILLVMCGIAQKGPAARKYVAYAVLAIGGTWLVGDLRSLAADNKREDFRSAVRQAIKLHDRTNATIAVAADPLAAAYYGLGMRGPAPCFPLLDSCESGFAKVPWAKHAAAEYALFWSRSQIGGWLQQQRQNHTPMVLLISRSRHPSMKDSAWWPIVQEQANVQIIPVHGFYVCFFF